jgi:hypothetical protein
VGSQKVSSQYVDKLLAFFLNVAKERGNTPGVYLLKIAEVLGILNWIPSSDPLNEDIATIGRQVVPGRVRLRTIGKSHAWLFHSGLDSWFEDVADVNKIVAPHVRRLLADGAILDKLAIRILDQIIEPKRQTWVERLELMAVFSQEAKAKSLPNPKEFMVLAEEVKQSVQLNQIPLMLEIGRRSVASATMRLANLSQ